MASKVKDLAFIKFENPEYVLYCHVLGWDGVKRVIAGDINRWPCYTYKEAKKRLQNCIYNYIRAGLL